MSKPAASRLLAALSKVFARRRVRWYLFGAQATVVLGRPRMTADVDVTADLSLDELKLMLPSLAKAGLVAREKDVQAFAARTGVAPLVHKATGLPLDLVLAGEGLEQEFLGRARPIDLGGVRVPVISPEDLIVTKLLAGRSKDLDDVRGVIDERRRTLDLALIRDVLGRLEHGLGRSDLSPMLERMLKEEESG